MGKAADRTDISVLFFPAGANFWHIHASCAMRHEHCNMMHCNMMQVPVLSALATGVFSTILSTPVVLSAQVVLSALVVLAAPGVLTAPPVLAELKIYFVLSQIGKFCHLLCFVANRKML